MSSNAPNSDGMEGEGLRSGVGPGRALREARVARGLSLEEVAGKLHLGVTTVQALETDDYSGLPPAIFVRGYLKNLARLLGLDPKQIVDAYERLVGRDALPDSSRVTTLEPVPEESRFGPALVFLGLAAFIGLGWWVYRVALEQAGMPEAAVAIPQTTTAGPTAPSSQPSEAAVTERASAEVGAGPMAGAPTEATSPSQTSVSAAPAQAGPPSIRVRFLGDSWVSVVDADGTKLLYELGSKGSEKLISGKPPFTVVLGRPAEISLDYKDQPYNHGHTNNRAPARFVIGP